MTYKTDFREIVEYLSLKIGPRSPGTKAEKQAADWIAEKFSALGYKPMIEKFSCPPHPAEKAILRGLNECEIHIIPTQHTPIGYVRGELVWLGFGDNIPQESLAGKIGLLAVKGNLHEYHKLLDILEDKQLSGLIVISPYENQPNGKTVRSGRLKRMITAAVCVRDARILRKYAGREIEMEITGQGENKEGSQNVIARLPGRSDKLLVVIAHYDSAAGSPGAVDNASGLAVLLRLAERFAGMRTELQNSVEFVASGAEEFGGEDFCGIGGKAYFQNRVQNLENIVGCFEIDHVGDALGVPRLRVWGPRKFLSDIPSPEDFVREERRPPGGDGGSAYMFGLPSVSMGRKFISAPYYHSPADTIELVDFDSLKRFTEVGSEIIHSLSRADRYLRFVRQDNILIRPARQTDIDRICEITRLAFGPVSIDRMREDFFNEKIGGRDWWYYKLNSVRNFALKHLDWILVAEAEDLVVGYASYILDNVRKLAEVGNNAVDPAYQGRGIGKLMQREVFARFEDEGYTYLTVTTLIDDIPARKIYERMGFKELTKSVIYLQKLH